MPNQRNERADAVFRRDFEMRAQAGEEGSRRVTLSFSSEEPYGRWWGTEILSHAEGAIDMKRLREIGVLLFNHNRDFVLGKVLSAQVQDERACAEVEFDPDDQADTIFQKVQSGTLLGVSVGYRVSVWEDVAAGELSTDGRFTGPCSIATRWEPFEISIVSVPADPTVGVGRGADDAIPYRLFAAERQVTINKNKFGGVTA